jgi:hypothetical protein
MTKGSCEERKRSDAVDHPIPSFFSFFFSFFSLLSLRCNLSSLSTIKGEIGHPLWGIERKAVMTLHKHTQPIET